MVKVHKKVSCLLHNECNQLNNVNINSNVLTGFSIKIVGSQRMTFYMISLYRSLLFDNLILRIYFIFLILFNPSELQLKYSSIIDIYRFSKTSAILQTELVVARQGVQNNFTTRILVYGI